MLSIVLTAALAILLPTVPPAEAGLFNGKCAAEFSNVSIRPYDFKAGLL